MSNRARANARYAFFKDQMRKQSEGSDVGTAKWRKKHGFRVDEVGAMRRKYRREVMASGDGSVVPTPVSAEDHRVRRTRHTSRAALGTAFDVKQVGTRLKRIMDETAILAAANPGDKQAEATAMAARDGYVDHLDMVARMDFAATLPTTAPAGAESFSQVV